MLPAGMYNDGEPSKTATAKLWWEAAAAVLTVSACPPAFPHGTASFITQPLTPCACEAGFS